jgi:hypothetical protein
MKEIDLLRKVLCQAISEMDNGKWMGKQKSKLYIKGRYEGYLQVVEVIDKLFLSLKDK